MVLRAGSTAPTPRSPAGLTAGGNIPWAHDHLEGHLLPAGLDITTLQALIDTAASLPACNGNTNAADTTTSGNGLAFMLPTAAATAGTNSLTSPSACGTTGAMGTGTGGGTGTMGPITAGFMAAATAGQSIGAASTAPSTLEGSNPHHPHHQHLQGGGGGGQQRALSLIAVFGPFAARGAPAGAPSRGGGLLSCGTSRTVTDNTVAATAAAILVGASTSSVSAPHGVAAAAGGSNYLLRTIGAVGGLGYEEAAAAAAAAAAVVTSGGAVVSGASVVAPEPSVLAREHQQLLLRLCEPEELTNDLTGLSVIGQGSQSVAFQALWRGARVVVKFSACASLDTSSSYSVVRQALVSKALSHPNVVQHYSVRCCQLVGSSHFGMMAPTPQRSTSGLQQTPAAGPARTQQQHAPAGAASDTSGTGGTGGSSQPASLPEPVTARRLSGDTAPHANAVTGAADAAKGAAAAKPAAMTAAAPVSACDGRVQEATDEQADEPLTAATGTAAAATRTSHSSQRLLVAAAGPAAALIAAGYTAGDATGDAAPMVAAEQVDASCAAAAAPDGSSTVATTITLAPFLSPLAMSSAAVPHGCGSAGFADLGSAASADASATAPAAGAAARFSSLFGSSKSRRQTQAQVQLQPNATGGAGHPPGSILSTAGCCARRLQAPASPLPPINFSAPSPADEVAADSVELHRLHSNHSSSSSTAVLEDSLMNTAYQQHQHLQHQQQHKQQAAPAAGATSSAPRLLTGASPQQRAQAQLQPALMPPLKTWPVIPYERSEASAPGPESASSDAATSIATPMVLSRQDVAGQGSSSRAFVAPFLSGASVGLASFAGTSSSAGVTQQSGELGCSATMSSPQHLALALRSRAAGLFSGPAPSSRHVVGGVLSTSRARSQQQPYAMQSPPPLEVISERDQLLAKLSTVPLVTGLPFGGAGDANSKGKKHSLRAPALGGAAAAAAAYAPVVGAATGVSALESGSSTTLRTKTQRQQSGQAAAAWEDQSRPLRLEQEQREQSCSITAENVLARSATTDSDAALTAELPVAAAPGGPWRSTTTTTTTATATNSNNNRSCAGAMVSGPAGVQSCTTAAGRAAQRGCQAAELVPSLPGVAGAAGISRQPEAAAADGTATGSNSAVVSSCLDAGPMTSGATPLAVTCAKSDAPEALPRPVTARSPDHNTACGASAAPTAAAAKSTAQDSPQPAMATPAKSAGAATTAAKKPAGKAAAAPGAAAGMPGGASPVSLSFNSYEGFGNPYGGSDKHSLSLSHVAALLSARQGEYLTAVLMEHADKSTLQAAVQRGLFKENRVWSSRVALRALLRTALEVCFALQHLHSRSVVHGALRPANVLLKSSNLDRRGFTVKVANFSLARVCCGRSIEDNVMEPFGLASVATAEAAAAAVAAGGRMRPLHCGEGKPRGGGGAGSVETSLEDSRVMGAGDTGGAGGDDVSTPRKMSRATANALPFWAPEQLCGVVGKASDVYAFGVLMYVMCVGNLPYAGVPVDQVVMGVANGALRPTWPESPPTIEQALAPQVRQLCAHCWQQDPRARPPFSALCAALQSIENSVRQQLRTGPPPQPQPPNFSTTSAFSGSVLTGNGSRPLQPATAASNLASPLPQQPMPQQQNQQQQQQQGSSLSGNALSGVSVSKTGTSASISAAGAGAAASVSARMSGSRAFTAGPGASPLGRSGNNTTGSLTSGTTAPQHTSGATSSSAATVVEAVAGGLCVVRKGNGEVATRRGGPEAASSVAVGTLGEMRRS
ncbi:hypothetical protein HXX76_014424 [Chlamydomonas incerta]|uniref:Protein kinase domain-containing protein n=1 Tax=Chlamydomonas incerta TaxID=51695 RepID=A0A835VSU5_CHLIN|nr:hypothetical protein HXX76_014424 [Chlamydomonas incerta]|eukprot:KAG2424543.1 hypothetical protein HXX76_014424 [Chlamydomonas incerta]